MQPRSPRRSRLRRRRVPRQAARRRRSRARGLWRDGKGAGPPRRRRGVLSSARAQKRARDDGSDGKSGAGEGFAAGEVPVVPAPGQQRLQERMRAELDAVRALHRKAVLLYRGACRSGAAPAAKGGARFSAAGPQREAAAKRSETCPSKPAGTAAAHQKEPVKKQQQQAPVLRAAVPASAAKEDARKRQRVMDDEIARAREECRRQVLEAERTALPDEMVYPHELAELGIAFEYAVTRTRSQALAQDRSAATR